MSLKMAQRGFGRNLTRKSALVGLLDSPDEKLPASLIRKTALPNAYQGFIDDLKREEREDIDAIQRFTGDVFRTSKTEDRIEMSARNELGAEAPGIYIYVGNLISTAYTQGTIFFYDNSGVQSATIQQPTAGHLGFGAESMSFSASLGLYQFPDMPTSNPGGSGYLWSNAGVINIT